MKKNKLCLYVLVFFSCAVLMAGCGSSKSAGIDGKQESLSVVCTTFPQYDWIREIVGEQGSGLTLTFLLDRGGDMHSYQPTAQDIAKIQSADLFVYVGGESDAWVEDVLRGAVNGNMTVLNLMEALGDSVREEEIVEGMEEADGADSDEAEYDEHIWLSLKNAAVLTETLARTLEELDEENTVYYAENAAAYVDKLQELDREYEEAVSGAQQKTILFGDRFPFRYLADDYGLSYYAAFPGCSAETEASFETITFLAGKVDELGLSVILTIDGSDQKIAETIRNNTQTKNQQILTLNSLQSVTAKDIENGFTYIRAMQENLEILKKAL